MGASYIAQSNFNTFSSLENVFGELQQKYIKMQLLIP